MSRRLPYLLFVLSGAAALVFEAVFVRQLAWLFGSSAAASALVLAAFMAGLALGAAVFGRLADRSARPLSLFGGLEIGTAVAGATLAWLLGSGRELFLAPLRALGPGWEATLAQLVLAFGLVLVPTVLMGGTLPALGRHAIRTMDGFVRSLGLLYGLNTLGAAVGVFLAGFYGFELLGISRSAYVAALVQVLVGLAALAVDRAGAPAPVAPASAPLDEAPDARRRELRVLCLAAAAGGGFAVLGYEVVWTRLLSLPMRSFSYSFSLMLTLFLSGLCIGAVLLGLVGHRVRRALTWAGSAQLAMGLYVALSLFWLPAWLGPVHATSFGAFLTGSALRGAWIVVPPTVLSGLVLPLLARAFAQGTARVGGDVGLVYGVNTIGAIAGSLVAGLLLLPALGAPAALAVLALINASIGALVIVRRNRRRVVAWVGAGLTLACLLPLTSSNADRYVAAFLGASGGSERIGRLLFYDEGAIDTVAIVSKNYGFHDPEAKSLITNGVAMSATVRPVRRYMSLEGHLPILLAAQSRSALAIGVGTGITLAALVSHPGLETITAVELSGGVIRGLPYFADANGRAYEDPRVTLLREDGRHYLELTSESFDVVTLEPPPPIVAGSVHLYSRDFYDVCRRHLNAGGVVAQWLPLHAQSLESARMTARTFLEAFPHVLLWLPSVRDAVLVGGAQPLTLDVRRLLAAYDVPATRADLDRAYLESPAALLGTFLLDRAAVERWADDVPIITDDRPWMEFFRHQGGNMSDRDIGTLLEPAQSERDWVLGLESLPELAGSVVLENRALRDYVRSKVQRDPRLGVEAAELSRGTEFYLYGLGCATAQLEYLADHPDQVPDLDTHRRRCAELREPR